jgi:hypothetical protein
MLEHIIVFMVDPSPNNVFVPLLNNGLKIQALA